MFDKPAVIERLDVPSGRRILAVSDIHGNLPYLTGLLEKAAFSEQDELIINGDFLEKGEHSLATLRYIMQLTERGNTHPLCGNCDDWHEIFRMGERGNEHVLHYLRSKKRGLLWDMLTALGIDPLSMTDLEAVKPILKEKYSKEWTFLASLPHVITAGDLIFAHAAIDPAKPLEEHRADDVLSFDAFLRSGRRFEKWVVVGHWPVMLYGGDTVSAAPIVDREHHIISIDGGCVLKDDGQLNALVIPDVESRDFDYVAYDPFPTARVLCDQAEGERSYYIRWGDSLVEVLSRGEEFSRCRHVRTGYEMDILTKYLFTDEKITNCNDCTDYILPLKAGDEVSIVETTSRGYFVKHDSVSGWLYGEIMKNEE